MNERRSLSRGRFVKRGAVAGVGLIVGGTSVGRLLARGNGESHSDSSGPPPVHRFHSRADLVPPTITIVHRPRTTSTPPLADGLLFLAPSSGPGQRGALIVDNDCQPIWFRPSMAVATMNFRAATYDGKPFLTWWEGKTEQGLGEGTHVIANGHYEVIARIPAGGGLASDLHECILTPAGTLLVSAWEIVNVDLTSIGGSKSWPVVGGVVQELAYPSGKVLFEWHSLDHIAPGESHAGVGNPFDYFHLNSIAETLDGNLLVSARNTWAIYKLDRGSGEVIWRLGGKRSDFRMDSGTLFAWQHDARPHGNSRISLFDDGAAPQVERQSRGLVLHVDEAGKRATLERAFPHNPSLLAHALGNTQLLPNGNTLIGYGTAPYFTEFGPHGEALLDVRLPPLGENYRALRFPWVGRPLDPPRLVASSITGTNRLYVSWNGATEVHSWLLRTGPTATSLSDGPRARRRGFESTFDIPPGATYAAAAAIDSAGMQLGVSPTIKV